MYGIVHMQSLKKVRSKISLSGAGKKLLCHINVHHMGIDTWEYESNPTAQILRTIQFFENALLKALNVQRPFFIDCMCIV